MKRDYKLSKITSDFPVPALGPTENYLGPIPTAANQCRCSSVFYSMLSACAVCQNALISTYVHPAPACTQCSPHYLYLPGGHFTNRTALQCC